MIIVELASGSIGITTIDDLTTFEKVRSILFVSLFALTSLWYMRNFVLQKNEVLALLKQREFDLCQIMNNLKESVTVLDATDESNICIDQANEHFLLDFQPWIQELPHISSFTAISQ